MNVLQLYIAKSRMGYKSLVSFNATEDVERHVGDMRQALEALVYNPAEKIIVYLLRYIPEGTLLTILRTIPNVPHDHLAATIFVPADMAITAGQLEHVTAEVTRKISASSLKGEDVAELRRLFATEYPTLPRPRRMMVSAPAGAYRVERYGANTGLLLSDFMENGGYEPELAESRGVLLVDSEVVPPPAPKPKPAPKPEPKPEPRPEPKPEPKIAPKIAPVAAPEQSSGGFTLRQLLITAGVSLVLGIVLGFCLFAGGSDEKVSRRETAAPVPEAPVAAPAPKPAEAPAAAKPATSQATPQAATTPVAAGGVEQAVAYLDANRTWTREAMEQHAAIAGLFDDLNSLNMARISDHWGPLLKDSKNFGAVVRAAAESKRKKVDVHREGRSTYNKPGDTAIGYLGYTYWIDP